MERRKILLADDDAEDRNIIQDAMNTLNAGDAVLFAHNGEALLELITTLADVAPCLIVLDLNMPRMNGTQTLTILKDDAQLRDIPVIIYSTSVNPKEKEICMALGAHSYISKPISFSEQIEIAKKFLEFCPCYQNLS